MADLADPVIDATLEPLIRRALREEAAAVPMGVTADRIRDAARHRRSPHRRRLRVAVAAAIAVVTVGATAVGVATRIPSGAAAPGAAITGLPGFDSLLEGSLHGTELGRGEGTIGTEAAVLAVPAATGFHPAEIVFACAGSPITLAAAVDGRPIPAPLGGVPAPWAGEPKLDCTSGVARVWIPGWLASAVAEGGVRVSGEPGTTWRAMVIGLPETPGIVAGADPVAGLPTFEELAALQQPVLPEVARAGGPASDVPAVFRVPGLTARAMQSVIACTGGPLTLARATGPEWGEAEGGGTVPCGTDPAHIRWHPIIDAFELRVYAPAGTAWVMLVEDLSGVDASPSR